MYEDAKDGGDWCAEDDGKLWSFVRRRSGAAAVRWRAEAGCTCGLGRKRGLAPDPTGEAASRRDLNDSAWRWLWRTHTPHVSVVSVVNPWQREGEYFFLVPLGTPLRGIPTAVVGFPLGAV